MNKYFSTLILLAAVPFGANRPWAWTLFSVLIALFGLLVFFRTLLLPTYFSKELRVLKYPVLLFFVPLIWAGVQVSSLIPLEWRHPFWALVNNYFTEEKIDFVSLNPYETVTSLLRIMSYGLVFLISFLLNRNHQKTKQSFELISYVGFLYAVYGLIVYFGDFNAILWFDKTDYKDLVTSTFINRNSYATFAGLTLLSVFPMLFDALYSGLKYGLSSHYGRQYFFDKLFTRGWRPILLMITIATAMLLTQSRGGFLSCLVGITVFLLILALSNKIKGNATVLLLVIMISTGAWLVFDQSGNRVVERLDDINLENNDRLLVYDVLTKAIQENPWLGLGYGSFEKSFRLYRDETIKLYYDKAHNTYLEIIFEIGVIPAFSLFMVLFLIGLIAAFGVWSRRSQWIYPAVGVASTALVATHAFVDFSLQIPAVAYLYALIMGISVSQAFSNRVK